MVTRIGDTDDSSQICFQIQDYLQQNYESYQKRHMKAKFQGMAERKQKCQKWMSIPTQMNANQRFYLESKDIEQLQNDCDQLYSYIGKAQRQLQRFIIQQKELTQEQEREYTKKIQECKSLSKKIQHIFIHSVQKQTKVQNKSEPQKIYQLFQQAQKLIQKYRKNQSGSNIKWLYDKLIEIKQTIIEYDALEKEKEIRDNISSKLQLLGLNIKTNTDDWIGFQVLIEDSIRMLKNIQ